MIDPNPSDALRTEATAHGFSLNPGAGAPAKLVLLAIKPQMLDSATAALQSHVDAETVIVSIRRQEHRRSRARLPQVTKIVRAMPNTPAAIGRGITGAFAAGPLSEAERTQVLALLRTTGRLEWLDHEADIDLVTALSGSGPAYVFHLVEAMAKAGEDLGLAPDLALRLARATVEGPANCCSGAGHLGRNLAAERHVSRWHHRSGA